MKTLQTLSLTATLVALSAGAQASGTPAIAGVVAEGTPIELIKEGFQGTEGPVATADGTVIFTEGQANRITRIAADGSTTSFLESSGGANGLGFNGAGELIAVQTVKPSIAVVYPADKARTLVDQYDGKPFNRPNDLVVDRHGGVYFTDPGARRNFAKLEGVQKTDDGVNSGADGLAVDSKGRLFVASAAGIQVFSAKGEALGIIPLPKSPQNLAFAGPGKKTLYVVGRGAAYRIVTQTEGYKGRAK